MIDDDAEAPMPPKFSSNGVSDGDTVAILKFARVPAAQLSYVLSCSHMDGPLMSVALQEEGQVSSPLLPSHGATD